MRIKLQTTVGLFLAVTIAALGTGCGSIYHRQQLPTNAPAQPDAPRNIVIFFDGTANDAESDTNIKRLHSLVTLQQQPKAEKTLSLYVEGVGASNKFIGMMTGWGFDDRIKIAYDFLLTNYRPNDQISIFGFSRGAYEARVLTSMLYYVGLPDKSLNTDEIRKILKAPSTQIPQQADLVDSLYAEMKKGLYDSSSVTSAAPFEAVDQAQKSYGFKTRQIKALGLWDTVSALGVPDWISRIGHKLKIATHRVDTDGTDEHYGDQLINVDYVFQAMSIDDDREWIFTPMSVHRPYLLTPKKFPTLDQPHQTTRLPTQKIYEVWFAGAHSDVGGGYPNSALSGVSLNWMISLLQEHVPGLLPQNAGVQEDIFGSSHDPESGGMGVVYHRINRNLAAYAVDPCTEKGASTDLASPNCVKTLCMHPTVFERREVMPPKDHENNYFKLLKPGIIKVTKSCEKADPPIYVEDAHPETQCTQDTKEIMLLVWDKDKHACVTNGGAK